MAYVYTIKIDDVIRYVGKGHGRRAGSHLFEAAKINKRRAAGEKVRTTLFYNKLAKALRIGRRIDVCIVVDGLSEGEAYQLEKRFIAEAPKGQLYNTAEGGVGLTSAVAKKTWDDPEYRARQAEIQEDRKKYVARLWDDPDFREMHSKRSSENLSKLLKNPDFVLLRNNGTTRKWKEDKKFRDWKTKHNREIAIANNARPEKKKQQSDLINKQNADPIFQERRVNALRIAFQVRKLKRIAEQMKEAYARGIT